MAFGDRNSRQSSFGSFSFFPPVLKYLIIINVGVFIIQHFFSMFYFSTDSFGEKIYLGEMIMKYFALMPLDRGFLPWQLITYQFMHGGFSHILFNMLYLWMFGTEIENQIGSKKFLIFYLTSGIGAGLTQLLIAPIITGASAPTVGASGSVYGVLIAFAMMYPDRPIYLYFFLPIKAKYLIGFMILIELFSVGDFSFVAHLAHIGGAVVGLIFVLLDKSFGVNYRFKKTFSSDHFDEFNSKYTQSFYHKKGGDSNIIDVDFHEINHDHKKNVNQEEIDKILDKINQYGYQSLTAEEKTKLYEASKNL